MRSGERIVEIDIMKGLGMCMVVFGHLNMYGWGLDGLSAWVYVFHVPMFFYLSGLFYREAGSVKDFIISKFRRLYLPFISVNLIALIIEHFWHGLVVDPIGMLTGMQVAPLVQTLWFVVCLFAVSVLYKIGDTIFKGNVYLMSVLALAFFIIGAIFHNYNDISRVLIAFFLYHLGRISYRYHLLYKIQSIPLYISLILMMVSGVLVWFLSRVNPVNMAAGQYGNPGLFLIGCVSGVLCMFCFSSMLQMLNAKGSVMQYVGKRTMWVIVLHMTIIQGVFVIHGLLSGSLGNIDPPMWLWYCISLVLAILTPCLVCDLWKGINHLLFEQKS